MKNILTLAIVLFSIMLVSTLAVIGFNNFVGFSTDVSNNEVATSISAIAFCIAVALKFIYDKK